MIFGFTKKFVISYLIITFMIAGGVFAFFKYTRGLGAIPFGGMVATSFFCNCSGNFLLTVTPPVGGQFVYYPGTQAYLNYNLGFSTGIWTMGLYSPGGVCMVYVGKGCSPFGVPLGTITPTVGSSIGF